MKKRFVEKLDSSLLDINHEYPIRCRVQSNQIQPPKPPQTFPTSKIKIGYAELGKANSSNSLKRLEKKNAADVLSVDYSFNEPLIKTEKVKFINGQFIGIDDFNEIISEKLRDLIQQKDRNRTREQDVYDLYLSPLRKVIYSNC